MAKSLKDNNILYSIHAMGEGEEGYYRLSLPSRYTADEEAEAAYDIFESAEQADDAAKEYFEKRERLAVKP